MKQVRLRSTKYLHCTIFNTPIQHNTLIREQSIYIHIANMVIDIRPQCRTKHDRDLDFYIRHSSLGCISIEKRTQNKVVDATIVLPSPTWKCVSLTKPLVFSTLSNLYHKVKGVGILCNIVVHIET